MQVRITLERRAFLAQYTNMSLIIPPLAWNIEHDCVTPARSGQHYCIGRNFCTVCVLGYPEEAEGASQHRHQGVSDSLFD